MASDAAMSVGPSRPTARFQIASTFESSDEPGVSNFAAITAGKPSAAAPFTRRCCLLREAGSDLGDPTTVQAVVTQLDELVDGLEVELGRLTTPS